MRVQNYTGCRIKVTVAESARQADTGLPEPIRTTVDNISTDTERRAGLSVIAELLVINSTQSYLVLLAD